MAPRHDSFDHLDLPGRAAAGLARRPAALVYALLTGAVLLSWAILVAMAARGAAVDPAGVGPGGLLLQGLPDLPVPAFLGAFFRLCLSPTGDAASYAAWVAMWFLMALAMMLPSAAPMIRTYCEIADTAAAKGERAAHPLALIAGYLSIWFAASAGLALLSMLISTSASGILPPFASAAALALAGAYQFTSLKEACLEKCRNPFAVLFARWSPNAGAIYRLGLEQGLWCLGCCWALMLVMFAVGVFNIFWMALIGVFAIVEKQVRGPIATRAAGAILLVWALALLVVSAR